MAHYLPPGCARWPLLLYPRLLPGGCFPDYIHPHQGRAKQAITHRKFLSCLEAPVVHKAPIFFYCLICYSSKNTLLILWLQQGVWFSFPRAQVHCNVSMNWHSGWKGWELRGPRRTASAASADSCDSALTNVVSVKCALEDSHLRNFPPKALRLSIFPRHKQR